MYCLQLYNNKRVVNEPEHPATTSRHHIKVFLGITKHFQMSEDIKVSIAIPFPTKRAAQIAYDVLSVDAEPKRSHVRKHFELCGEILKVYVFVFIPFNF